MWRIMMMTCDKMDCTKLINNTEKINNYKNNDSKEQIEEWKRFSMTSQSEEDIKNRLLNDPDSICMSYICRYSKLSMEFIQELFVLTTGLIHEYNYDLDFNTVKMVVDNNYLPKKGRKKIDTVILHSKDSEGNIVKTSVNATKICDRMDFRYLSEFQNLSEDFIRTYLNKMNINTIIQKQNISEELLKELREIIAIKSDRNKKKTDPLDDLNESIAEADIDDFDDDFE